MLSDKHFKKYSSVKIRHSTCPLFMLIASYTLSDIKSMFITNITKSTEDRFREAIFSKVLLHLNDITTLSQSLLGALEGIWGSVAKNFFYMARRAT